ncbi:hypothetical protein ACDF64_03125 [Agromyces sp. MMS24-JH15]|uniref:hypothetical protein n=1 Tax=Agromyces sp. MMS24-JH15 TaxID=3243765 RepID=UPI0037480BED
MSESTSAPGPAEERRRGGARFWVLAIIIGLAIIVAGVLIYQASYSAFTAQTEAGSTAFSVGTVDITNDKEGTSVFTATNLKEGSTDEEPVVVTYSGSLDAEVRLFAETTGVDQDLAEHLQLTITPTGGQATGSWSGTLAEFQTGATDYVSGILPIAVAEGDEITYTVAYEVLPGVEQGATADVTFVWEAQNT